LAGSTIGIKIADGSYYPVLEESFTGTKRLTLTTVKDDQDRVQIDLYRGEGNTLGHAQYVGSLIIENIPPAPQGEPEIELILGIDAKGELTAEASDRSTGESQVFSIGIRTLAEGETYAEPEFAVEPGGDTAAQAESEDGLDLVAGTGTGRGETFDEVPLTGDTYPVSGADRRRVPLHHRAPGRRAASPALVAFLVVLAVALLAALGYVAWRLIWGPPIPPLSALFGTPAVEPVEAATVPTAAAATGAGTTASTAAEPAAATTAAAAATGDQSTGTQPAAGSSAAAASTGTAAAAGKGVSYRIKRGDTLWDISSTYYRNPWQYPMIARANGIKNPDLIIAGARIFIPEQ
jgi:LysM repeat protein/nitrate reductase NapE component